MARAAYTNVLSRLGTALPKRANYGKRSEFKALDGVTIVRTARTSNQSRWRARGREVGDRRFWLDCSHSSYYYSSSYYYYSSSRFFPEHNSKTTWAKKLNETRERSELHAAIAFGIITFLHTSSDVTSKAILKYAYSPLLIQRRTPS